jgi:hypothetical protein
VGLGTFRLDAGALRRLAQRHGIGGFRNRAVRFDRSKFGETLVYIAIQRNTNPVVQTGERVCPYAPYPVLAHRQKQDSNFMLTSFPYCPNIQAKEEGPNIIPSVRYRIALRSGRCLPIPHNQMSSVVGLAC